MSDAISSKLSLEHAKKRLEEVQAVIEIVDFWLERTGGRDVSNMTIPDIDVEDWVTKDLGRYYKEERGWDHARFDSIGGELRCALQNWSQRRAKEVHSEARQSWRPFVIGLMLVGACAVAVWRFILSPLVQ